MRDIYIATNNGAFGGGEIMLFNIAEALRDLGHHVTIVTMKNPNDVANEAIVRGFDTKIIAANSRKSYLVKLFLWAAKMPQKELLWCNGLVPSLAGILHKKRIMHLHQLPVGVNKLAFMAAKLNAKHILVPSIATQHALSGSSEVLYNWVEKVESPRNVLRSDKIRIGFLGRPAVIKGTDLLSDAVFNLVNTSNLNLELVIGGESNFVASNDQEQVKKSFDKITSHLVTLGWVDPQSFFQRIDILVVPSTAFETFGLVVAEAMSAKVPVIISDVGALPEVTGLDYPFIFKNKDKRDLENILLEVITELNNQGSELERWLEKLHHRWESNFSPAAGRNRLDKYLQSLDR